MLTKIFGGTTLGIISTILIILGAALGAAGTVGTALNNNLVVAEEAAKAAAKIVTN